MGQEGRFVSLLREHHTNYYPYDAGYSPTVRVQQLVREDYRQDCPMSQWIAYMAFVFSGGRLNSSKISW